MKAGRWALWHRETITTQDGRPYMTRVRIVMTPLLSLYRHRIHREDWDRALHDHPFPFISLITRGGYVEQVAALPRDGGVFVDRRRTRALTRGNVNVMTRRRAHIIRLVAPDTRTLVLVGPRRRGEDAWGFWVDGDTAHTPWRDYLRAMGHPQAGEN